MILDEIVEETKKRIKKAKEEESLASIQRRAKEALNSKETKRGFVNQLKRPGLNFICEVKKASPSKGIIAEEFPYVAIAREYEKAGAACISVLTEPYFFKGQNTYLTEIKQQVGIPVLRKDFIIDAYQIYEAKAIGADCILLICAILSKEQLKEYLALAKTLQMDALVEAHDELEVSMALEAGAVLIGVNNRNLKDFSVDITRSLTLRKKVPKDIVFVAESGIKTKEDILQLYEAGANGVLIGETFMRSNNKREMLQELTSLLPLERGMDNEYKD